MTETRQATAIQNTDNKDQKIDSKDGNIYNQGDFICGVVEGFYGKPWTFEQRKNLFKRLRELNLNSFMYAPKDDTKHRAKWRQMYSDQEARELKTLIDEAAANGIDFFYSLAPGLDMVYTSAQDSQLLCRKYQQLKSLGCKSFAILFDDIETKLKHEKDRQVFKSNYAAAQVQVTNLIYKYLNKPTFLFCPTEYCESRAVPDVPNSLYLNTIGTGLHQGIDIMWSGERVISRYITEESIRELNSVIKRPPLIWENLHANDYDKRRVYMGPYSGRSTKIIPLLRGVLTNPNCEYEANYIAIHTLAQWKQCKKDSNPHNKCNQPQAGNAQPPQPGDGHSEQPSATQDQSQNDESVYDPDRALARALRDWLPHVLSARSLPQGVDVSMSHLRNDDSASQQVSKEESSASVPATEYYQVQDIDVEVDMQDYEQDKSPASNSSNSNMDTSSSCDNMQEAVADQQLNSQMESLACSASSLAQPHDCQPKVDMDSLALLVDFFYLPFEHGIRGYAFLSDIKWLIDHSELFLELTNESRQDKQRNNDNENESGEGKKRFSELWLERANILSNICICINKIVNTLVCDCPNKLLMAELYPYLKNLNEVILITIDYIEFLRRRKSNSERFYYEGPKRKHEYDHLDAPWSNRGGLVGDLQRLISS